MEGRYWREKCIYIYNDNYTIITRDRFSQKYHPYLGENYAHTRIDPRGI